MKVKKENSVSKVDAVMDSKRQPSYISPIALPVDFEESREFRQLFEIAENTSKNLFITGVAGSGKSTWLTFFRKNTRKNVVVLAPTGIAAVNVQGQTIHSFFKFPHSLIQKEDIRRHSTNEPF